MPQYKVPQNVESEDTILGPLTIKQFIYVVIAIGWGFLCWRVIGVAPVVAIALILPVSGPLLALGLIRREGQSFETYFVAMIRFLLVPRKRTWHKDEARVIIKAEEKKPIEQMPTRNQAQVRGELRKLATIVDSRGRIPKGTDVQAADANVAGSALSQRVITPEATQVAGEIISTKVAAPRTDMLDMQHNPQAVAVGELLKTSGDDMRAQAIANMQKAATEPTATPAPQAQASSQDEGQNAILQRAVQNSDTISVQQLSDQVNRQNVLQQGQSAQVRQA
jgi:hypothetical protein